jgi:hypothetical protein
MTARINSAFAFTTGVYFGNEFILNNYEIDVDFNVESEIIREQNIALERIKYFLNLCVQNSIFICEDEDEVIQKYLDADLKVCTLPEEPYDQIIGIMLISKLNSINEGRLVVTDITISSSMSDGVWCKHSIEENLGPFNKPGWWNDSSTKINTVSKKNKSKKIVKLIKNNVSWEDLYLGWEETPINAITTGPSNEVMFANFDNKTDKS